jgi:glycerol-1-phosphate dehydrogenase [NAD(P)+]
MSIIKGQTNVKSVRFGTGSLKGIGKEIGKFTVMTMDIPWQVTEDRLGESPLETVFVTSVEKEYLDQTIASLPKCDAVIGIGGGKAIDAAKYMAWKRGIRLVSVPTIISVDAFVTPAAGIRINHEVVYMGQVSPDPLIIDYEVIRSAPASLNIAGIGDLLSIHTATFDWELAEKSGDATYLFSAQDITAARKILDDLYQLLPQIRDVSDVGLRAIVEGYMRINTICLPAGHYRVEEGSEHFLFYELEERLRRPFIHGNIVGLGIYLMSRLQRNQPEEITRIMDKVGLEYQPIGLDIQRQDLIDSLKNLKTFVSARDNLWYTIIDHVDITDEYISEAISNLKF